MDRHGVTLTSAEAAGQIDLTPISAQLSQAQRWLPGFYCSAAVLVQFLPMFASPDLLAAQKAAGQEASAANQMENRGFEPLTSAVRSQRSTN